MKCERPCIANLDLVQAGVHHYGTALQPFETIRMRYYTLSLPSQFMSTEGHRIFLSLASADVQSACRHAKQLLARTSSKGELFLVGPRAAVDVVSADVVSTNDELERFWQPVHLPGHGEHSAALAHILGTFQDRDFLFVKSGIVLPEDWDVRLAWTAQRFPGIATVSPVFDDDFAGPGDATYVPFQSLSPEELDRLCYRHSRFWFNETGDYREDCMYVRSEAVRAALPDETAPAERIPRFGAALKKLRYSHLLADHIFARGPAGGAEIVKRELPPSLLLLRHDIHSALNTGARCAARVRDYVRPRVLHVTHSWGGGLDRWVREYCREDCIHDNLILKSVGYWGAFGMQLALHRHSDDPPVETFTLDPIVKSTASNHSGYRAALAKIVDAYGIEAILISSLIGHSLDIFDFGIPVVMVCHDYYPFCPALNITFNTLCQSCDCERLVCCTADNPHHRFFRNTPPLQWMDLRSAFVQKVLERRPALIAPSPSVRDNYARLVPEIAGRFEVISHGTRPLPSAPLRLDHLSENARSHPLRVVILGSLAPHKGADIVKRIVPEILAFCDLFLVGCGEFGQDFASAPGIKIIPEYRWDSLPELMSEIGPDLALLPSVVPETFSLTLQELFELAIPTLATDLGSFHDRIVDGVNGFLCRPDASHVAARLEDLAEDRESLARVHQNLCTTKFRHIRDMLADYRAVLGALTASPKAYFCADSRHSSAMAPLGRFEVRWLPSEASFRSKPFRANAELQHVDVRWPEQKGSITAFEFHPIGQPGVVVLHKFDLRDRHGETLWAWSGDVEAFQSSGLSIQSQGGGHAIILLKESASAISLVLPFQAMDELRRGGSLAAEFEWPSPGRAEGILNSLGLGAAQPSEVAEAPEPGGPSLHLALFELRQAQSSIVDLNLKLGQTRAEVLDLRRSLSWKIAAPIRILGGIYLKASGLLKKSP